MHRPGPESGELRLELMLSYLLRAGVVLSAAIVLAAGTAYLVRYGFLPPDYRTFRGEPAELRSVPRILESVLSLRRRGTIQFGLLLLIMTPVARVAASMVAYVRLRDRTYVVVTLIVLAVLVYSLIGAYL